MGTGASASEQAPPTVTLLLLYDLLYRGARTKIVVPADGLVPVAALASGHDRGIRLPRLGRGGRAGNHDQTCQREQRKRPGWCDENGRALVRQERSSISLKRGSYPSGRSITAWHTSGEECFSPLAPRVLARSIDDGSVARPSSPNSPTRLSSDLGRPRWTRRWVWVVDDGPSDGPKSSRGEIELSWEEACRSQWSFGSAVRRSGACAVPAENKHEHPGH